MKTAEKLKALRELMSRRGIDAWIQPTSDPHQSEYLAEHWKGRHWLSGFSGSAGIIVVTAERAILWADSRYWLQAAKELDGSGIELYKMSAPGVPDYKKWLAMELEEYSTLGFDGNILSCKEVSQLKQVLVEKEVKFRYDEDLLDVLWQDRPAIPQEPACNLPEEYTGESVSSKIERVAEKLSKKGLDYYLITALDDIAWLFNIRGSDIRYNPVVISYAFLSRDDVCMFINKDKLDKAALEILESCKVKFFPYDNITKFLNLLPQDKKLLLDPEQVSESLKEAVNCEIKEEKSIITILKSIKNEVEQSGIRKAHIYDGVALVRWIRWIQANVGKTEIDEYSAGMMLEEFRKTGKNYRGPSFTPIVGYKENGAIVHYSAKKESAKKLAAEGLLLVDSGGQYPDGTTDVTRTISLGNITLEEKYYFTLVLMGHIDLARVVFPAGTSGVMLDSYARKPLWQKKLNYGHGTGHGVGHYLCVHEGPQGISPKNLYPFEAGTVTSNEPGIYLEGKFGIRLENMMICQNLGAADYGDFCGFETVTLCPLARELIEINMMNKEQIDWLDDYHEKVYITLSQYMNAEEKAWLRKATLPLRD